MKPYLFGLLILTVAMAYSQETNKIEEYLNPGEPINVQAGQDECVYGCCEVIFKMP